ncbi:MAG TPA: hypothetical protein VGO62_20365 [Myxococcota bacterium]|jgi:hypothetical protein
MLVLALAVAALAPSPSAPPTVAPPTVAPPTVAPPTAPTVALAVQPAVGLSDAELATLSSALNHELAQAGLVVVGAPALDPACVGDPACVERARASLPSAPSALLVVEMIRVGPVIQLTATGASAASATTGSHGLDEAQQKRGPLLPDAVRAWAHDLVPKVAPPPPLVVDQPVPVKPTGPAFTPLQTAGLVTGGVGAIAVVAGIILAASAEGTLEDPSSQGVAKSQAGTFGVVGLGAGALGVIAVGTGAMLFLVGAP